MQRIYLVRHGETDWNRQLRYQGQRDIPLNEEGHKQALCIADYLATEEIHMVYSSPLLRAWETATKIGEKHHLQISAEHALVEIDFGEWEGRTYSDLKKEEQNLAERWFFKPDTINIPGGESYAIFKERVLAGYSSIRETDKNKNIVVVTHAGVIRIIVASVLKMPADAITSLRILPASLTVLLYDDWENSYLELFNQSCYLQNVKKM